MFSNYPGKKLHSAIYDCKYNNVINMILMLAQKKIFIDETA